ncbi:MAG: hypothetical protein U0794_16430 [Isosphaeraceae bacterium]
MTFETCQSLLVALRNQQGTRHPLVRIDHGGVVLRGRVARSDCDPGTRHDARSPFGVLVLESLGLVHGRETIIQIAEIPEGGIRPLEI